LTLVLVFFDFFVVNFLLHVFRHNTLLVKWPMLVL
jgi:hypothetical protein